MQLTLSSPKRVNHSWKLMKHGESGPMRKVLIKCFYMFVFLFNFSMCALTRIKSFACLGYYKPSWKNDWKTFCEINQCQNVLHSVNPKSSISQSVSAFSCISVGYLKFLFINTILFPEKITGMLTVFVSRTHGLIADTGCMYMHMYSVYHEALADENFWTIFQWSSFEPINTCASLDFCWPLLYFWPHHLWPKWVSISKF